MTSPAHASPFVVINDRDAARWELRRDGQLLSVLEYHDDGRTVAMTRAFTIPTFRGHGHAARVVAAAVADLAAAGDRRIDPVCWYVAEWFSDHPEHAHLLRAR